MGDFIRSLLRSTSSHHRPWQLSAAVAVGLMCGLLPKFSLTFLLLAGLCCVLPVHLPLAAATCLVSSTATTALATTAGRLGVWSLTHPALMEIWLTLDVLPWVPWLGLNNSIVHGSLLIGLAALVPVFVLSRPLAIGLSPARRDVRRPRTDPDFEYELRPTVSQLEPSKQPGVPIEACLGDGHHRPLEIRNDDAGDDAQLELTVDEETCQELEDLLATCNGEEACNLTATEVAQRAAQMAQFVDELLTSCQVESRAPTPKLLRRDEASELGASERQRCLGSIPPANPPTSSSDRSSVNCTAESVERPAPLAFAPDMRSSDKESLLNQSVRPTAKKHVPRGPADVSARRPVGEVHQAETLRYLLHHLKAIKDKV